MDQSHGWGWTSRRPLWTGSAYPTRQGVVFLSSSCARKAKEVAAKLHVDPKLAVGEKWRSLFLHGMMTFESAKVESSALGDLYLCHDLSSRGFMTFWRRLNEASPLETNALQMRPTGEFEEFETWRG